MFLYLFIFFICILFSHLAEKSRNYNIYWVYVGLAVASISYFAGCRDIGVGIDTVTYSQNYFDYSNYGSFRDFIHDLPEFFGDKGFLALNYFSHFFDDHVWVALFLVALWIYGFAFTAGALFARKLNFRFELFVFLYLFIFYNTTFNLMRQHCALSVIMLSYYFFYNKNYKASISLLVLSYFFHTSVVAVLPLPILYYIGELKNKTMQTWLQIAVILILTASFSFFYQFIELLSVNDIISDAYSERYGADTNYEGRSSVSPYQLLYMVIPFVLYYVSYQKNVLSNQEMRFNMLAHVMYVFFWFFSFISIYLFRLGFYYQFLQLFVLPYIFKDNIIRREYKWFTLFYIVFLWWFNFIFHGTHGTYPYTSTILGI